MNSKKDIIRRMSSIINFIKKKKTKEKKIPKVAFFRERINVHPDGSQEQKCWVPWPNSVLDVWAVKYLFLMSSMLACLCQEYLCE